MIKKLGKKIRFSYRMSQNDINTSESRLDQEQNQYSDWIKHYRWAVITLLWWTSVLINHWISHYYLKWKNDAYIESLISEGKLEEAKWAMHIMESFSDITIPTIVCDLWAIAFLVIKAPDILRLISRIRRKAESKIFDI